jgi:hypothetical protein
VNAARIAAAAALAAAALTGCGRGATHGPGRLRYANAEPVTLVNDRRPIAAPEAKERGLVEYYVREDLIGPTRRALTVSSARPAANANSMGDVPDSAWFTNRAPTPDEIRRGPGGGGPDRSRPWRVVGVKVGGAAIGIQFLDGKGDRYLLKFDERGHAETETTADVIVQRLTWAFGYNVPENEVVEVDRSELQLDPKAVVATRDGDERPMTEADLDKYLGMIESEHGRYRGLASRYIDGKVLGGVTPEGVRADDPNDRVPHELRRDLRGQRVLWAWVNHPDIKTQNTLATYTDDGYVKWYTLDFGESLGVGARTDANEQLGFRKRFTAKGFLRSLFSFGLVVEPWERRPDYPDYRGLGRFDAAAFRLSGWRTAHNWRPTDAADRFDEFWAARILMRFSREHVAAAVEAGQYSDPRTAEYVTETLLARQRVIGQEVFSRVAPLDDLAVREKGDALEVCFTDLWLRYGYGIPGATRYRATSYDYAGTVIGTRGRAIEASADRSCIRGVAAGRAGDGYTIVRVETTRGDDDLPLLFVHVARGPDGYRVIGLDRR